MPLITVEPSGRQLSRDVGAQANRSLPPSVFSRFHTDAENNSRACSIFYEIVHSVAETISPSMRMSRSSTRLASLSESSAYPAVFEESSDRWPSEEARIEELMKRRGWQRVPTQKQRDAQCFKTRAFLFLCCVACAAMLCTCVAVAASRYSEDVEHTTDAAARDTVNTSSAVQNGSSAEGDAMAGRIHRIRRRHHRLSQRHHRRRANS